MALQGELDQLFRAKSGRLLAALIAQCKDLQLAEDALQDAFVQASEDWQTNKLPKSPEAWLLVVARRRLIDKIRRSTKYSDQQILATINDSLRQPERDKESKQDIPDERLKLLFSCCHPALKQEAQVALTLKTLCGLSAREIARAYLISETAMNQRLVRAKQKIRKAGIPYKVPQANVLNERVDSVLAVIYLIYNESYSAYEGQTLTREDLAKEAIRLARILCKLLPQPEVAGLLSLMLLHQSRQPARSTATQRFIPLEYQDRRQWDQDQISDGRKILLAALSQGKSGKYQLQAAISALHSEATTWQQTDWQQIALLYLTLYKKAPSPIVKLNGLVAMAQAGREKDALDQLENLATELSEYQPYYAARAELEARQGFLEAAKLSYQQAIARTNNEAEKHFLSDQLCKISDSLPTVP